MNAFGSPVKLSSVARMTSGGTPASGVSRYYGGGIPWVSIADMTGSGKYIAKTEKTLSDDGLAGSAAKLYEPDVVLYAMYASLGECSLARGRVSSSQAILGISPGARLDREYLYYYLQLIKPSVKMMGQQGTQSNLNAGMVRNFEIPLPGVPEQKQIADVLARADVLISSIERIIAKKRAIKQGMMQELLTGRTRLPGFVGRWHSRKFAELLSYQQPGRFLVSSTDYVDAGTPVLTAGKTFVLGYTMELTGIYDVLPAIIFDDFTTDSKYVAFRFKAKSSAMKILTAKPGVDLRFAFERMQLVEFVAVDHKRRWIGEYSRLEVEVPTIDEQRAIARVAMDAQLDIVALERRLETARAIKQGMMQELLTGRTRLVSMEASA